MKKRILSILLAVAMLLPLCLLAMPIVAAETPAFTAKEYDNLYVKDGLVLAFDFFGTNEYWGGEAISTTDITEGAAALNSFRTHGDLSLQFNGGKGTTVIRDGYFLNNADVYQLLVHTNVDKAMNYAYNGATMQVVGTMATTSVYAAAELGLTCNNIRYSVRLDGEGKLILSSLAIQNTNAGGYLDQNPNVALTTGVQKTFTYTQKRPIDTQNFYSYSYPADVVKPTTSQYSAALASNYFYVTHTATKNGDTVTGVTAIPQINDTDHRFKFDAYKPVYVEFEGMRYIVGAIDRVANNAGETAPYWHDVTTDPGHLAIYENTEELYRNDALRFPNNTGFGAATYWRLWGQGNDMTMNAVRYYSRILTADEMALNHAADLFKWFRLDITRYARLSAVDRAVVASYLSEYDFTSDPAEIQTLVDTEADALVYDILLEGLTEGSAEYNEAMAFLSVAKAYSLDVAELKVIPTYHRTDVYRAVASYTGEKTTAALQEIVDDAILYVIDTYYGEYIDKTVYDYRDLYVRRDQLSVAVDFFAAKPEDGSVYVGVSYDDWEARYNIANTGEGWKELEKENGDKFETKADALQYIRDTRSETPRANNWSELIEKYVWAGDKDAIQALDISDRNYPHSNIRTYGDGRLICTYNNSLVVKFEDDASDVTYQVVSKMTKSPNWQLRGFRVGMSGTASSLSLVSMTYQAFGVSGTAVKPSENQSALYSVNLSPRPMVSAEYSTDLTVVADKRPNSDYGHYYDYYWDDATGKYVVTEVASQDEAKSSLVTYYGRLDLSVYGNGNYLCGMKDVSYQGSAPDSIGNSGANEFFAIRVYSCTLTPEEIKQNHFADLAGYYGFDLSLYNRLTLDERAALHDRLADLQLGTPEGEALAAYDEAFRAAYYNTDGISDENAEQFMEFAAQYQLNIASLRAISPISQSRVYATFTSEEYTSVSWFAPVLQGLLEDEVSAVCRDHYAESIIHNVTAFRAYQLKKSGDYGMRSVFTLDNQVINDIRDAYDDADITVGMLLLPSTAAGTALTANNGELVIPDAAIASAVAYEDGAYTDSVFNEGGVRRFACEFYSADVNEKVAFVGYVLINLDGEETLLYTIPVKASFQTADAISIFDLTRYAKTKMGMAYENIQRVMNAYEEAETGDIILSVGGANICDYVIVDTIANTKTVKAIQDLLYEYTGVRLAVVTAEEAKNYDHVLTIGTACDVIYEDVDLYGITQVGKSLKLWYLDEENASLMCDLFEEYLAFGRENDGFAKIAAGTDLVRRAR